MTGLGGTRRSRVGRVVGFATGLCLLGGFVMLAATQAAAQFDRAPGNSGNSGAGHGSSNPLTLTIRQGSTTYLHYDGLMPGEAQTRTIDYAISSDGSPVDLWIVFDPDSAGYQAFTGAPGSSDSPRHLSGGLGPYAYFSISDTNGGPAFESGNLRFVPGSHNTGVSCTVDPGTGRGGGDDLHWGVPVVRWASWRGGPWSDAGISRSSDRPGAYPVSTPPSERVACGVPGAIRLAANLRHGAQGTVSITLGLDPTFTEQDAELPVVPFTLVAMEKGAPNPCQPTRWYAPAQHSPSPPASHAPNPPATHDPAPRRPCPPAPSHGWRPVTSRW